MLCMQCYWTATCWNLSEIYSLISNKLCLVSLIHGSKSILSQFLYWGFTLYGRNPSLKEKTRSLASFTANMFYNMPTYQYCTNLFPNTFFRNNGYALSWTIMLCHALMVMCYCTLLIRDHWVFSSTSYFIVLHRYK